METLHDFAQGVDIGGRRDLLHLVGQLLGSAIVAAKTGIVQVALGPGETQVNEFHMVSVVGNQDIAWFQIQVQHPLAVKISQGIQQLVKDALTILIVFEEVRMRGDKLIQTLAIHVVHLDERTFFVLAIVEIAHNVRVLQFYAEGKLLSEEVHVVLRLSPSGLRSFDAIGTVADDALVAVGSASTTEQYFDTVSQGFGGEFGIFGHSLVMDSQVSDAVFLSCYIVQLQSFVITHHCPVSNDVGYF